MKRWSPDTAEGAGGWIDARCGGRWRGEGDMRAVLSGVLLTLQVIAGRHSAGSGFEMKDQSTGSEGTELEVV